MDIKIEAPGHPSQDALIKYYENRLNKKYGTYDFIKSIYVKVNKAKNGGFEVSLGIKPEKSTFIYVTDTNESENKALSEAIRKMNVQIEKYKQHHYHSVHTVQKQKRQD